MISIIILTWNSRKYIKKCLESVFFDIGKSNKYIEVIVVDGGSTDCTLDILEKFKDLFSNLQVIRLSNNRGTTASRNIGIKKSTGKYIFILDSDTEIQKGTIDILVNTLKGEERIGIVAPRLYYPNGYVQSSCKRFPTIKTKLYKFLPFERVRRIGSIDELYDSEVYEEKFDEIVEVDYCISAAWMIKREVFEEVGLFDKNIFYSPEDVDFCLRMWMKNWKVLYNPSAKVIHHAQRISYRRLNFAWTHFIGLCYYFRKHKYLLNRERLYKKIRNKTDKI